MLFIVLPVQKVGVFAACECEERDYGVRFGLAFWFVVVCESCVCCPLLVRYPGISSASFISQSEIVMMLEAGSWNETSNIHESMNIGNEIYIYEASTGVSSSSVGYSNL